MQWKSAVASVVAALVMSGCTAGRAGLIRDLPPPLFDIPSQQRQRPFKVIDLRSVPRPRMAAPWTPSEWRPSGGISSRWSHIVIHHSASASGNARRFDSYHRNVKHWDELGYHFVIGNGTNSGDGEIEVGPRWIKQKHGAHCKTPGNYYNRHGIGICLVGDYRRAPPSDAQMASLTRLVLFLMRQCGIAAENIVTHGGVAGGTICPGPKFPMDTLRRTLIGGMAASTAP